MFVKFMPLLLIFNLYSCSTLAPKIQDGVYISSGIERFFLANKPEWLRFSEIAHCSQSQVQYLDFTELKKRYQFDYKQSVYMQNLFNEYVEQRLGKKPKKNDQNKTFFEAYQQIDSGANPFINLKSPKIYIVSIDSYWNNAQKVKSYVETLLPKGQVVLLSRCMSSNKLSEWKRVANIYPQVSIMGLEYFSTYDANQVKRYEWRINLDKLFSQKLIYYISGKSIESTSIYGYTKKWVY